MDLSARPDAGSWAIGEAMPARVERPDSPDALAELVRDAGARGECVVPWGGGVALRRESPPPRYDLALDCTGLTRITHYEADDFTVTAEAGVSIDTLRATLAERGQELPLECAEGWGATLGGVLAANASGARRLRLGAPRDRILGARFVTGDGVLARTGGRVVKNVAGLAIHRLLCGSRGALATFVEASLKLLPMPPARAALVHDADATTLAESERWRGFPMREPAVLTVIGRGLLGTHPVLAGAAPFAVVTGFEEDAAWVDEQLAWTRARLGAPRLTLRDASVTTLWTQLADFEEMSGPRLTFTTSRLTPDAIAPLLAQPIGERLLFHAAAGRLHLWPPADDAPALIAALGPLGFALIGARGVAGPRASDATRTLRERVRAALDPGAVMALGEAWAGGG